MRRILLDTDPGVDDALAFMLACASPELSLEAVTTVSGNVSEEKGHGNAKKLLEFLGRTDVPVAHGAASPLVRIRDHAEEFHGATGIGGAVLPEPSMKSDPRGAVELITELSREHGRDLTLVAIGPLTNVASAVLADPGLPHRVAGLVVMGGAFGLTPYGFGNANAVAEFNVWHDPEAARVVFRSGIPLVCAGLDTTTHPSYRMSRELYERIKAKGTRRSGLVADLTRSLVERYGGVSIHDPMAVAYAADPSLFETTKVSVDVETQGELTSGMTVVERRRWRVKAEPNAEVITVVDAARFLRLFEERVAGG